MNPFLGEIPGSQVKSHELERVDLVTTGTPAGVGVFRKPQVFLKAGDTIVLEVEGIGQLENPVVAAS